MIGLLIVGVTDSVCVLTTALLVFCLIGLSLEAHNGGRTSLRVFLSLVCPPMDVRLWEGFGSRPPGGWKSGAPGTFSL